MKKKLSKFNIGIILWLVGFVFAGMYGINTYQGSEGESEEEIQDLYSASDEQLEVSNIILSGGNESADINLTVEGKAFYPSHKIIGCYNRYYIDVKDICSAFNVDFSLKDDDMAELNGKEIDVKTNQYKVKKSYSKLRGQAVMKDGELYMTISDLGQLMDLRTTWNDDTDTINLYKNRDKDSEKKLSKAEKKERKNAFLRLEDVNAGGVYMQADSLLKFRIEADYLKNSGSAFHVAWVPRYVNPSLNIDNDLTKNFTFKNAEFLYTLDYVIYDGGIVGLHGYTHQYGDNESIIGSEFEDKSGETLEQKTERVKNALENANLLNIPHVFFETPHYRCDEEFQNKVLEEYFNYLYEPAIGVWNHSVYRSENNNRTKYIPAPLGYVADKDVESLLEKIKGDDESFKSMYYHPTKEFEYINIKYGSDGYPYYEYDENSMLHQIVNTVYDNGYYFESIEKLK